MLDCRAMGAIETCNFDLHCHSTISDGVLAPHEIVRRAAANGVSVLALTDHDELAGLAAAADAARADGIRFGFRAKRGLALAQVETSLMNEFQPDADH